MLSVQARYTVRLASYEANGKIYCTYVSEAVPTSNDVRSMRELTDVNENDGTYSQFNMHAQTVDTRLFFLPHIEPGYKASKGLASS